MSLTSLSFEGIYFPLLLLVYYNPLFRGNTFRKLILAFAGIGLYALCEPLYVFLLLGVILVNYALVRVSDASGRFLFRATAIALDAAILLFFKYINVLSGAGLAGGRLSAVAVPIGLSYFIFKSISYAADSRRDKRGNLADAAIYISNFLTIVSGPLSTYTDELGSIREKESPSWEAACRGFTRLMIGLSKKVIIADSLSLLVTQCFAGGSLSVLMAWAGGIGYTLQLYFDFSGYTDMALGIGELFGFRLPENFHHPYMADSVSEFWKRWHMSLTKWFTKYIYIPLGGSRVSSRARHIFNLFVVWLVTGMWHGSSLNFLLWAMIYFVLQLAEKYTGFDVRLKKLHLGHPYTLLVVTLEWVIFRSSGILSALAYIGHMFGLCGNALIAAGDLASLAQYAVPLTLGAVFSTDIGEKIRAAASKSSCLNVLWHAGLIAVFLVCVIITIGKGYSAPLYAGF